MSENQEGSTPAVEESLIPQDFRLEVDIKGLPYIFEGNVPNDPTDFKWTVSVPNWEEQKAKAEEVLTQGKINPNWVRELPAHDLGEGRVGALKVTKVDPADGGKSLGIDMVETATVYLPKELGYYNAEGIGSFLLDNLCAFADIKKWRIYLQPVDKGGNLTQDKIYNWYKKRGFQPAFKFPKESRDNFGEMQRRPTEPDVTQAIAKVIK
jgi:hypothetical protein